MKKLMFALCLIAVAGCETATEGGRDISNELVYFKDYRAGQCFAFHQNEGDYRTRVLASVPCTEQVEKMLVNKEGGR